MKPFLYFYGLGNWIRQTHEKILKSKGKKHIQSLNSPLVSNSSPSSRTEGKFNRKKPSQQMKLFLYFYGLANWICQTHGKIL